MRLARSEAGNLGDTVSVGAAVSEMRIFAGKGYRLYFTIHKRKLVILLCGGDKSSQTRDIEQAKDILIAWSAELHTNSIHTLSA